MTTLADIQADLEAIEMQLQTASASMSRLYAKINRRLMDYAASPDWTKLRDRVAGIEKSLAEVNHEAMKTADWLHEIK